MFRKSFIQEGTKEKILKNNIRVERYGHGVERVRNELFVIGGKDYNGEYILECEKFNMITEKWSFFENLPFFLSEPCLISVNTYIYIISAEIP